MAVVVVNCPPFKGALTACHPAPAIHRRHPDAVAAKAGRLPRVKTKQGITPALSSAGATTAPHHQLLAFHLEVFMSLKRPSALPT
jgi:hypothetical protein